MSSATAKVRILIVDDHALFRESVARLLNAEADFEVVGACGTTGEALRFVTGSVIDLVLLDFDLGQQTGFDFFAEAKRIGFQGKVLIVTAGLSETEGAELMRQGGAGIFMKHGSAAALAQGIRQVMSGRVWLEQKYLRTIFEAPPSVKHGGSSTTSWRDCRTSRLPTASTFPRVPSKLRSSSCSIRPECAPAASW
jgi:DNA-binding NarL/FixJ family response regulator